MSQTLLPAPPRQRALVVEPDLETRLRLTGILRDYGMEVADCADVTKGRELFADQRLVVAPLNGDNAAMKEFVAWVRAEAGVTQPWIIALGVRHELAPGETPAHYGVNDLLTGPVDTAALVKTLEMIGLGRTTPAGKSAHTHSPAAPPSYQRPRSGAAAPATPWDAASAHVLLEHFPAAVAVLDKSMKYLAVNSRWVQHFQIPRLNLTGRNHYEIFPDLHPDWRALYDRCLAGDEKQTSDDVMQRPDGTECLVHWEIQPWHETTGAVGGLVLTCETIKPEAAPESPPPLVPATSAPPSAGADHAFREMAEAAPFGMILLDDEAHVLYANPQHRAVLGFAADPGESLQPWLERACSGDEVFQKRALDEWWESVWRRHTALTCSLRNADGLVKDIEFRPAPLPGDRLLLTIFDVTDARLDEQAVRTSEARYRGLFQHASAALLMINPAGNITEVNPAFETLTGLPRHEARRAAPSDFLPAEAVACLRDATHAGGSVESFGTRLLHRAGHGTPVQVSVAVIRNDQGLPAFTACLFAPLPAPTPDSASTAWEQITPDWLFLLDADGAVLEHTAPRDFKSYQATAPNLKGELPEVALPALCGALPLDVMMERLLDAPGHETRCEYTIPGPDDSPDARRIEARLILLPSGPPSQFGLTLRDVTRARTAAAPDPAPSTPADAAPNVKYNTNPSTDPNSTSAPSPRPSISLHRARNDLQVLTSLMALQADHSGEPGARTALHACRDRLAAVSLIYRLVQHEDDPVDFARFITELGRILLASHRRPPGHIAIEPLFSGILLPQRLAISLGLIMQELINSSLAWSFPDENATGHIRLTLNLGSQDGVLILRDNGLPLSPALQARRAATFSSKIIQTLTEQTGGQLTILSDLENQVRLRFRLP